MIADVKTAEQLARLPDDGNRYELVEGVLRMMSPAGGRHGRVAVRVNKLLANHVDDHDLGATFAAETGFLLAQDPDTVRAPDGAFASHQTMAACEDDSGYLPLAPDLAVEVVSPTDNLADVKKKASMWLDHGTKLVLIVEPSSQTVHACRSGSQITVLRSTEILDASDAVDGWRVAVDEFFP